MLLALPCGRDEVDVLQQSKNLQTGFIMYLQQKQAAGIVNIAAPGSQQVNQNSFHYMKFFIIYEIQALYFTWKHYYDIFLLFVILFFDSLYYSFQRDAIKM